MHSEVSGPATPVADGVPVDSIHAQVERILASRRFSGSERHCRLLRYLLQQTLEGRAGQLKEYVLGVEVFNRGDSFDPQTDPIVRSELSRLRTKLNDYYQSDGRDDVLIIDLPKRSYSLAFQLRESGTDPQAAPAAKAGKHARFRPSAGRVAVATLAILVLAGFWGLVRAHTRSEPQPRLPDNLTSVAVLPFVNVSGDPESEYFSDGLTEELIHWLAEVEGLRVVSRTSSFQFKGKHEDPRTIGAQLDAGLVLEGTVRRSGDQLRITTRLVNAADGYQLGSHIYERRLQDGVAVQQEIGRQVANALRIPQVAGSGEIAIERFTHSVKAFDLYLEGRYHANSGSESGLKKAIHCYQRAIAADPDYTPALASLADAYLLMALLYEAPPDGTMQRAKEAAQRAVKTGKAFSQAHSVLGSILSLYDWDWAAAQKEFSTALELDPNDSAIREAYAMRYLLPQGRLNSALFQMQLAQSLDPYSPEIALSLGKVHHFKRDPDRAIMTFQRALHLEPEFEAAPLAMAKAYVQKSLPDQALKTLQEASAPVEDEARLAVLGHAYALSRQPDQARQVLEQLREVSRRRYVSGYYFALIHIGLGEKDQALDWLEKAAAERSPLIVYLKVNPLFDSLRAERRFTALLSKAGLGG